MSELQIDDPDPLPERYSYPVNVVTDLPYEGYDLSAKLLLEEILSRDERKDIVALSNNASKVLDIYGEGEPTRRRAYTEGAELYRVIEDGAWIFTLEDTLDDRRRCRQWKLDGEHVSWCDTERRYEEVAAVQDRLLQLFPIDIENAPGPLEFARRSGMRIKRALASTILR